MAHRNDLSSIRKIMLRIIFRDRRFLDMSSPIARFSDYDTDHVGTGYDCDVTLAGIFRGNFTAVTACRNACIHGCLSFWPNAFFRLPE